MLEKGNYPLNPHDQWVWLAVERGSIVLTWNQHELELSTGSTCFLPGGNAPASIGTDEQTRCLWIALEGPLSPMVVRKMGALLHMPLKQGALPSQIYLAEQIVQVIVRHSGTADATYQLQHLMYGMIASHWGQPVAMDAMLSHEIAKVVDTLRANQYKDNFSLADMAAMSARETLSLYWLARRVSTTLAISWESIASMATGWPQWEAIMPYIRCCSW